MDKSLELQNKNVGIWIRVSTEDQARGDSPEVHEIRARAYAESRGWFVKEVYHLEAVSGKSVMEHPECQRMLNDVCSGKINALIFSKLARLARNTKELLDFSDIFRDHDADLISLQESIDTSTPVGRLFYTVIAAMAQWEREEIADRVKASIPVRAKMGKSLGGKAPYGYQWKDGECVPHPDEAPICKQIYELFQKHRRFRTVARLLNEAGYRTSNGKLFEYSAIVRVLTNPAAKGIRRANYVNTRANNQKRSLKPETEWVHVPVEAIVSEELWDECNAILDERPKRPPAKKAKRLLAGFTYCECGHKMYPVSNSPKYVCQKCRNKIAIVDLDSIYYEQLKGFFHSPEDIEKHLSKADSNIKEKEELIPVLLKEQDLLKKELDMLYQLYFEGKIDQNEFGVRYNPLKERSHQIEFEIPRLQGELDALKISYLSSDLIISEAKDLYSRWPKLDFEEKRNIVENITDNIIVGKDDITINLFYLPSTRPSKEGANKLGTVPLVSVQINPSPERAKEG